MRKVSEGTTVDEDIVTPSTLIDSSSSESDLTMIESSEDKDEDDGTIKKRNNRLMTSIDKLRKRADQSRQVLSGIVESFMSDPSNDGSKLEESLTKYDEIVEDIEADFTKAKIEFGLRMEQNIGNVNKSLEQMEQQLNDLNQQFINWSSKNRAKMTNQMRQGILQFNDFLSSGVEMFLEVSEKGKDVLRNINRRRFDSNNKKSTDQENYKNSGFFIPFLGQL